MTNEEFLHQVETIAKSKPAYRIGGDGSDGTCDCVGLIIGAVGKAYDLHSSNYFARFQMQYLDSLLDESQLHPGSIVYKSRRDTSNLHERYQPGGRYNTGDLLDYYHVGVVTSVEPLEITHCTSADGVDGIAYDDSIRAYSTAIPVVLWLPPTRSLAGRNNHLAIDKCLRANQWLIEKFDKTSYISDRVYLMPTYLFVNPYTDYTMFKTVIDGVEYDDNSEPIHPTQEGGLKIAKGIIRQMMYIDGLID